MVERDRWLTRGHHVQAMPGLGLRIELVGIARFAPGETGCEHDHAFHEALLVMDGPIDVLTQVGDRRLDRGRMLLVPPGLRHAIRAGDRPARLAYLGASMHGVADMAMPIEIPPGLTAELTALIVGAEVQDDQLVLPDPMALLVALVQVVRNTGLVAAALAQDPAPRIVQAVRDLVAARLDQVVSVRQIARSLYLTPNHVGEVFRRTTGMTIKAYHRSLRLQEAAARLLSPGASPGTIAQDLGYPNIQEFSKAFRAHHGMTPSAWRLCGGIR
ncbi:transcriptional regulator [Planctomycetota bacterium]|nr:transcriptional regulator [Planctomycetota bacterium]